MQTDPTGIVQAMPTNPEETQKLLTVGEIAQRIGQSKYTVYRKIGIGALPAVRLGDARGFNEQPPPDMFTTPVPMDTGMKLERRHRLKRPAGKRLDDAFYKDGRPRRHHHHEPRLHARGR